MKSQVKMTFSLIALLFGFALFNPVLAQKQGEHLYVKIEVDGLSCPFCAFGLERKLKKIKGVKKVDVSVRNAHAMLILTKGDQPEENDLRKVVKNAGFTPREISFSSTPFKKHDQ